MTLVFFIAILVKVLCCATLVVSIFPLVMMPFQIFKAHHDDGKLGGDRGNDADSPLIYWVIYTLLVTGVVFSLFQLGLMSRCLALAIGSACVCLLALMRLFCDIATTIYMWIAKRWKPQAKDVQQEGSENG